MYRLHSSEPFGSKKPLNAYFMNLSFCSQNVFPRLLKYETVNKPERLSKKQKQKKKKRQK